MQKELSSASVRLTQTVQKGGCAAKVAAEELRRILAGVKFPPKHDALMIDGTHFDDAAVYRVSDDWALVQTVDFFTPIVDDPETFGKVAACNALSDVYAMGGRPITAMAILAFPLATLGPEVIQSVLQGASDLIAQAGATLVGGHSIDDDTLKFGLSVTGRVRPDRVWSNQGAQTGDALILTKPLGTGTLTAALKRSYWSQAQIQEAVNSMCRLNNVMDFLSEDLLLGVHAATDVTGFGLSGHSWQMALASGKTFEMEASRLPVFSQARESLQKEFLTKAHRTNRSYTSQAIEGRALDPLDSLLVHDPQTSGGLLLSVDPSRADAMVEALTEYFPGVTRVGKVVDPDVHGQSRIRFV